MARKLDLIKEIDGRKETLKLAVRITDLWCVQNRGTKSLEMIIMDSKGDKIQATVRKEDLDCWEPKLKEGNTYIMNNFKNGDLMIMILTQARVKEGTTIYATSISNSWHGSKVLINEVMPEIVEFKARFTSLQINDDVSGESQQLTQMTQGSSLMSEQEKFLYKAAVKSISEINALKEDATIVTIGIIGNFVVGKSGWYYLSCSNCFKKSESNIAYRCSCGTYNENLIPRYKLEAKVYLGKDSANFIFWDRDCTCLIGKSALKLRDLMIECGEDDPKIFPEPLDDTLARTLAYRAKYQVAYNSISVSKVSDDAEFIKVLKEQMCCNEPASQTDNETLDFNEVIQLGISFSTTADQLSSETHSDDELLSQELAVAQLSSTKMTNKMAKQINTE